jgi:hypothetical protein
MRAFPACSKFASNGTATHAKADRLRAGNRARNRKTGIGVMLKAIYAIVAAAIVAAVFVATLSLSAQVEARGSVPGAKADRADIRPLAGKCSQNAWPYFEAACLRDTRNPFGQAHDVRLVSTDRLASAGGSSPR